ncbi:MAG: hypothetical protein FD174_1864 [Geobacteraceae bacterium]|nr:MAG: hypothetical protein FD174_1864 [Geobacteraceae bacterium]
MKANKAICMVTSAILGTACSAFAASGAREDNSDFVVWAFLAFCALIVIGQLFPLIRNLRTTEKRAVENEEAKEKV